MLSDGLNREHKWVEGYEGLYSVTTDGRVYSHSRLVNLENSSRLVKGRWLKETKSSNGYLTVTLYKDWIRKTFQIHQLVARAFLENEEQLPYVNHKDEDKYNNSVDNLEWCTPQYNSEYILSKTIKLLKDGDIIEIFNMSKFCRDNGLSLSSMKRVSYGQKTSYRGYTKYEES